MLPLCRDRRPHGHLLARRERIWLSFIEHVASCSMLPANNQSAAEESYHQSIGVAREQSAKIFELRAVQLDCSRSGDVQCRSKMRPHCVSRVRFTFGRRLDVAKFSGSYRPSRGRHSRPQHFLAVSPPRMSIADGHYQNDLLISSPCPGVRPISSHWRSLNILSSRRITARCRHSTK